MASKKKSVLFICLGNICRSPIAEAVFRHQVKEAGLEDKWYIDSAAIGTWHVGGRADSRAIKCLKTKGIETDHIVRQITKEDYTKFDIIFGMDDENIGDLKEMAPKNSTAQLKLLGEYDPEHIRIIEDPYYPGNYEDFVTVLEQCIRCCKAFLNSEL
ncbi:hypothetical protein LSH36_128g05018 [Paralvinella palmiformis]|uniref:Low molecular weight phosphotyrosine protein phosphatase n=1 Tax=Paralvinella palmiformis TaxID=53620 RepID=A0AAD9JY79_9ANNE|nr:hypothetical protein LSH36_128g05018 [Paralvinella palmiformis]